MPGSTSSFPEMTYCGPYNAGIGPLMGNSIVKWGTKGLVFPHFDPRFPNSGNPVIVPAI